MCRNSVGHVRDGSIRSRDQFHHPSAMLLMTICPREKSVDYHDQILAFRWEGGVSIGTS
jgi:hypothetical protein